MLKMFLNTAFHVLLMKYLAKSFAISKTGLCESGCMFNVCLVHTLQLLIAFFQFFLIFEKGGIFIFMKSK